MKRILSSLNNKRLSPTRDSPATAYAEDSPEAVILREVVCRCPFVYYVSGQLILAW
jgi:hypothetical protein